MVGSSKHFEIVICLSNFWIGSSTKILMYVYLLFMTMAEIPLPQTNVFILEREST